MKSNKKTPTQISPAGIEMLNTIPSNVATPFPPLNPAKMGYTWPRTAANPNTSLKKRRSSLSKYPFENRISENEVDIQPFKTSNIRTNDPAGFPKTLNVFVAPAFPDPWVLISRP